MNHLIENFDPKIDRLAGTVHTIEPKSREDASVFALAVV
jgi:hypothetical protein